MGSTPPPGIVQKNILQHSFKREICMASCVLWRYFFYLLRLALSLYDALI